ncbi:putative COX assembly mitochondrial protein-like protein [Hypsibius exemplaris]|uniref:COX assembly mitochondrial protein n=1 Tax=Hypsibius exemplaris TaxID=2072580 RepID=A0A1W0WL79_HYPEX|nr:putative COX assembly mitochondrial protein-like protein [Hypsibius exemplaris]
MSSHDHPHPATEKEVKGVLAVGGAGGPHGLGDPNDQQLRKVEQTILIPKIMRERTRIEKCKPEYEAFEACGKEYGLRGFYKCREENTAMQTCMGSWYSDPDFIQECTEQYLRERTQFRRTGIMKPKDERVGSKAYREKMAAQKAAAASAQSSLPP